ncbi:MAG: NAD(P)-dependent glycerol-3-phosphate dehydrogenase [Acidobacteria bacterium]|nr:NAD(P)-dependent glycerol-3-phosphate dehydrogenase [Acidobacteriota bacterium]
MAINISIIGAGGWGTALAHTLAGKGHRVMLWAYEKEVAEDIESRRENRTFLPGIQLAEGIKATNNLGESVNGAAFVVLAMPSHTAHSMYTQMLPHLDSKMVFVSATKGMDTGQLMRMSEVFRGVVGTKFEPRFCALSGPSFAREVAAGSPTALVVASEDAETARLVQHTFSSSTLRLYASRDVIGVELGGAVKNVIAIAAGVVEGLGLGHNPAAALITRGLAEMTRLATACGARPETLAGLAGLGDLVLTCTGDLSRNRQVGIELARGRQLEEIVNSMRMVAEGVKTTVATVALSAKYGVEMPVARQVNRLLRGEVSAREAIRELMERSLKEE